MKLNYYVWISLLGMVLFSYSGTYASKAERVIMQIKSERADCVGVGAQKCYWVKYQGEDQWQLFYEQIEGFDFEEGYQYVLKVKRTQKKHVPTDASAYVYRLIKTISKEKVEAGIWSYIKKNKWKLIQFEKQLVQQEVRIDFTDNFMVIRDEHLCEIRRLRFAYENEIIRFEDVKQVNGCLDKQPQQMTQDLIQVFLRNPLRFDVADQTLNFYGDNQVVIMLGRLYE